MNSIRNKHINFILLVSLWVLSMGIVYVLNTDGTRLNEEPKVIVDTLYVSKTGTKGVFAFMRHIGKVESDNKYHIVNRFGMLGKYQFAPQTLKALGYNVTKEEFLSNPELQDEAMIKLIQSNKRELRQIINKFAGKTINGVYITESGIIAGAHLVGKGGVLSFFYPHEYSYPVQDRNGTAVQLYMKKFAGYNLKNI